MVYTVNKAKASDHRRSVLLLAWRAVFDAANAEEVEALACKEGIELAVEWMPHRSGDS